MQLLNKSTRHHSILAEFSAEAYWWVKCSNTAELIRNDQRLLHHFVLAVGASGRMANDILGDGRITAGDSVQQIIKGDFCGLRCAMFTTGDELFGLSQCRFINENHLGFFYRRFKGPSCRSAFFPNRDQSCFQDWRTT